MPQIPSSAITANHSATDRTECSADTRGALRLNGEQRDQDQDRERKYDISARMPPSPSLFDAHRDEHVFDGCDDDQGPDHK
jgi:hypothetical protein